MTINTVLVVEDDKMIRRMLRETLEKNDFLTLEAAAGERSFDILDQHKAHIILMDLNLPDGCGLEFIKRIKQKTDVPIIVLSAEEKEHRKVQSLEAGADDFIAKPFSPNLLIALINAHLRRYQEMLALPRVSETQNKRGGQIKINRWTLDHDKFQLFNETGIPASLTIREFKLLDYLLSNTGRAIPRHELCEVVREDNYIPTPRALDVKITRIRKKIDDSAPENQIIKTVRGVGYMVELPSSES